MNLSVRPDTPKAWEAGFPGRQEETQKQDTEGKGSGGTVNPFARKSVGQTMQDMTLHGVVRIAEVDRAVWSRAVWTLKTLASFGVFLYLLHSVMSDYYEYPHKTIVEATPASEIEFPAVTICNFNTFDVTQLPYGEALSNITASTAFSKEPSVEETQAMTDVYNMSAQQILEDTEAESNTLLKDCWYNEKTPCHDIFNAVYWGTTRCFTLNTSKLEPAIATSSLVLVLTINQDGYVLQTEKSAGVKFFIHDKHEVPNLQARASSASPGFSTYVALSYKKRVLLDYPYTSFGGRYCVKTDAIDMSTLPGVDLPYRLINCLKAKAAQLAQDNCTCSLPFSSNSSYPNCTLRDMGGCVQDVLDIVKGNQYDASEQLGCPLPCETVTYDSSVTFGLYPSAVSKVEFLKRGIFTEEHVSANIVKFDFYYSELVLHEITDVAEYSSNELMGLLGGNMGFFLGASVMSVCELAELGMILLCSLFNRLCCWNKNRVQRQ